MQMIKINWGKMIHRCRIGEEIISPLKSGGCLTQSHRTEDYCVQLWGNEDGTRETTI